MFWATISNLVLICAVGVVFFGACFCLKKIKKEMIAGPGAATTIRKCGRQKKQIQNSKPGPPKRQLPESVGAQKKINVT